jgi:hypothetical protein
MRLYNTPITLERLKKHNKIFFDNASFHGDKGYEIIPEANRTLLLVHTSHGKVYYKVESDDSLTHTSL